MALHIGTSEFQNLNTILSLDRIQKADILAPTSSITIDMRKCCNRHYLLNFVL